MATIDGGVMRRILYLGIVRAAVKSIKCVGLGLVATPPQPPSCGVQKRLLLVTFVSAL